MKISITGQLDYSFLQKKGLLGKKMDFTDFVVVTQEYHVE